MKAKLVAVLLCCPVVFLLACFSRAGEPTHAEQVWAGLRDRFSSGKTQIRKAYEKKKAATSWHMRTEMRLHPGNPLVTEVEVSCPDRERIATTMGGDTLETIRIGGEAWVRQSGGDWQPAPLPADWSPCGQNPGLPSPWAMLNEGRDMTTVLATLAESAQVQRGELVQTPQGRCTQWKVSFGHPQAPNVKAAPGGMYYMLCVGDDHYPVMAGLSGGGITNTYSDWNKPIQIDRPQVKPGTPPAGTPMPMQNPHAGMFSGH